MGEVIDLPVMTTLDIPVEKVLRGAVEHGLTDVLVCGWDESGHLYAASSTSHGPELLWLLEKTKSSILEDQ